MTKTQQTMRDGQAPALTTSLHRAALAAFFWALLFGLVSFSWAAGGALGANTLSRSIQALAERRDPAFVATVWITGVAKVLGGLLPLALAFGWWSVVPRRLLEILCWVGGVLLVLYGLGDVIRAVLVITGAIDVPQPEDRDIARWYLWLWGPVWIIGGICYLATAWMYRKSPRRNRPTARSHDRQRNDTAPE